MDISVKDEARFYKRSCGQKIECLNIAKTYIDHVSVELFYFSNDKLKRLLSELETEIQEEVARNELKAGKYKELIKDK